MNLVRIRAEELSYPALFLEKGRFLVWRNAGFATLALGPQSPDGSGRIGQLVDKQGLTRNVVGAEDALRPNGRFLTRDERRALTYHGVTLICDGEPFMTSVDDVRQTLAWLVSARGHFESPAGFGFPSGVAFAASVEDLIEALVIERFG